MAGSSNRSGSKKKVPKRANKVLPGSLRHDWKAHIPLLPTTPAAAAAATATPLLGLLMAFSGATNTRSQELEGLLEAKWKWKSRQYKRPDRSTAVPEELCQLFNGNYQSKRAKLVTAVFPREGDGPPNNRAALLLFDFALYTLLFRVCCRLAEADLESVVKVGEWRGHTEKQ